MVFQKIGDDELDAVVNVRLTSEEKERLRDDADMAALSMSALVRARYFGRPVVAHADQVMIKELRRLGGLLKKVHTDSDGAYSAETSAALYLVSEAIRKVSKS
ncbi:MAG TPA: MobB mobilization protein [Rhodoferax sp.]|nr:MobB mobilization protein [Rhodoferax sp.]